MRVQRYHRLLRYSPSAAAPFLGGCNWVILDPKGPIGQDELSIIVYATFLMGRGLGKGVSRGLTGTDFMAGFAAWI